MGVKKSLTFTTSKIFWQVIFIWHVKEVYSFHFTNFTHQQGNKYCYDILYACVDVALTGGHILGLISTKLGMMDGCGIETVTVTLCHGPVITAVPVGVE